MPDWNEPRTMSEDYAKVEYNARPEQMPLTEIVTQLLRRVTELEEMVAVTHKELEHLRMQSDPQNIDVVFGQQIGRRPR